LSCDESTSRTNSPRRGARRRSLDDPHGGVSSHRRRAEEIPINSHRAHRR
jgi:hypothetical protein